MLPLQSITFYNSLDSLGDCTRLESEFGNSGPKCELSVLRMRKLFQSSGRKEIVTVNLAKSVEVGFCDVSLRVHDEDNQREPQMITSILYIWRDVWEKSSQARGSVRTIPQALAILLPQWRFTEGNYLFITCTIYNVQRVSLGLSHYSHILTFGIFICFGFCIPYHTVQ